MAEIGLGIVKLSKMNIILEHPVVQAPDSRGRGVAVAAGSGNEQGGGGC